MGVTTAEMVRGIQCLAHVTLNRRVREAEIWKLYRAAWNGEPFVSFTPAKPAHFRIPDPRFVLGSNRVLTGFMLAEDGRRMIAASAIQPDEGRGGLRRPVREPDVRPGRDGRARHDARLPGVGGA